MTVSNKVKSIDDDIKYKDIAVSGVKSIDEETGIVEAFVSGIGNKDSVNDIIVPGAFDEWLKDHTPKGVWSHDWSRPVSKTLEIYEVPAGDERLPQKMLDADIGGLYVKTQFNLNTQDGRDAFEWVKFFGEESEWSIGYKIPKGGAEFDKKQQATLLKNVHLFEYSPVLFGANPLTSTVGVKVDGGKVSVMGVGDDLQSKIAEAVSCILHEGQEEEVEKSEGQEDESPKEVDENVEVQDSGTDDVGAKEIPDNDETDPEVVDDLEVPVKEETAGPSSTFLAVSALLKDVSAEEAEALKEMLGVGEKALPGSLESRQEMIREEINRSTGNRYAWIVATFESSVIYELYSRDEETYKFYEVSYSISGDEVTLGEPTEVEIIEVVVAKRALVDAIFKGYGQQAKSLMKPFLDVSFAETEEDEELSKAMESVKAGAAISASNRQVLQGAYDLLGSLLSPADVVDESSGEGSKDLEGEDLGEKAPSGEGDDVSMDDSNSDDESGLMALSADDIALLESLEV